MTIYSLAGTQPQIAADAYVAPGATVIGNVVMQPRSSVWFGAILRGDNDVIDIGEGSNVQDGCVLHIDPGFPLHIARNVTLGHQAMVHGCTIGEQSLIGIGSILLNGCQIGRESIVGANTLIPEGKEFPDGVMILGSPGRIVRELTDEERSGLIRFAEHYQQRAERYRQDLQVVG